VQIQNLLSSGTNSSMSLTTPKLFVTFLVDVQDREKELLLKDLKRESVFGSTAGQRIGAVCSRQIFHVLMSQNGNVKVDGIDEDPHED